MSGARRGGSAAGVSGLGVSGGRGATAQRGVLDRPVLFVTGHAPPYRHGALARLHELEGIEVALFGGRLRHGPGTARADSGSGAGGTAGAGDGAAGRSHPPLPFPHRQVRERDLLRIAASGRHRAIVCSTGGRVALPATWAGARSARLPLILWSSLWAHPRSPAHVLSWPALRRLYRSAEAVVTYGPHVSEYVARHGAVNVHVAPQSVDNDFWADPNVQPPGHPRWPASAGVRFLFAGRPVGEKGLGVLIEAWRVSGLGAPTAALVLVGAGSAPPWVPAGGAVRDGIAWIDPVPPEQLRNFYAFADVLVLPSIPTSTFKEPWGLVINEAMNRAMPVIASDAVGAAAGGLVRDRANGLIVPSGDAGALASAMRTLAADGKLRTRLGEAGAEDVRAYDHDAWARGFSNALASIDLARTHW